MDEFCARFHLNKEHEIKRWKRAAAHKRKRNLAPTVSTPSVSVSSVFAQSVSVSAPTTSLHRVPTPTRPTATTPPPPEGESVSVVATSNDVLGLPPRYYIVGFTQMRMEAPQSMSSLKNLSEFTVVETEVLMWYDVDLHKSYFLLFEVRDNKVLVWSYSRGDRNMSDFVARATDQLESMRGTDYGGGDDVVSRMRAVPWVTEARVCAEWGRAMRAILFLQSKEAGALFQWNAVFSALLPVVAPARKWKSTEFVASRDTPPCGVKLKYVTKSTFMELDHLASVMANVDALKYTTLDALGERYKKRRQD